MNKPWDYESITWRACDLQECGLNILLWLITRCVLPIRVSAVENSIENHHLLIWKLQVKSGFGPVRNWIRKINTLKIIFLKKALY
jgi:hypothetical protein